MAQPRRSSAINTLMIALMVVGTLVATVLVLNYLSHRSQKTETVSVSGTVECTDGSSVVGVKLVPTDGQARDATWQLPSLSTASKATFTYDRLHPGSRFKLFVGCGGVPNAWATQNWGPEVDTTTNREYICNPQLKDPDRQTCQIKQTK